MAVKIINGCGQDDPLCGPPIRRGEPCITKYRYYGPLSVLLNYCFIKSKFPPEVTSSKVPPISTEEPFTIWSNKQRACIIAQVGEEDNLHSRERRSDTDVAMRPRFYQLSDGEGPQPWD